MANENSSGNHGEIKIPKLTDRRLGLRKDVAVGLKNMGFNVVTLLSVMLEAPEIIADEDFKENIGMEFDELVRRLKSVLPAEVVAQLEERARANEEE